MFKKIIVNEDLDPINLAVVQTLKDMDVAEVEYAKYCDETFLKIKKAKADNAPFDLLITDLSFRIDHRIEKLLSGEQLIKAVREFDPTLKIIVFSIEDKTFRIKSLFNNLAINAYVMKSRNSLAELKKAVESVYHQKEGMFSGNMTHVLDDKTLITIEAYDIDLLFLMSNGKTLEEITAKFKNIGLLPNSSSSVEKRINKLKTYFNASNNVHLIGIAKDLGLI